MGDVESDRDQGRSAKERGRKAPSVRCLLAAEPADQFGLSPASRQCAAFAVAAPGAWQLGNALATRFTVRQVRRLDFSGEGWRRSDFRAGPECPRQLGGQGPGGRRACSSRPGNQIAERGRPRPSGRSDDMFEQQRCLPRLVALKDLRGGWCSRSPDVLVFRDATALQKSCSTKSQHLFPEFPFPGQGVSRTAGAVYFSFPSRYGARPRIKSRASRKPLTMHAPRRQRGAPAASRATQRRKPGRTSRMDRVPPGC